MAQMRSRCRRHRLCPRLRASALCAALACCLPAAAPSDSLPGAGVVDVDNQQLPQVRPRRRLRAAPKAAPLHRRPAVPATDRGVVPQGERLAVLLVGLFKPKVTDLVALPCVPRPPRPPASPPRLPHTVCGARRARSIRV